MNGLPVIEKITSFPFYLRYQVQPHFFLMMTYRPLAKYHFGLGFIVLLFVMVIGCEKEAPIYQVAAGEKQMWPQDLSLREAAKQLYEAYYLSSVSRSDETPWTGDEPSCNAGEVPMQTKERILTRLSYYRKAAGLHNKIIENVTKSGRAQAAALMMYANQSLNHTPPDTWKCYTEDGRKGAANSLLTLQNNAEAIDTYMRDQGENNGPVGHRRWLLWPELQEIGIGNTQQTNAIWVLGNPGIRPAHAPQFIAWPPSGYLPKQLAPQRWSFSMAEADFSKSRVEMKDAQKKNIPVLLEALDNSYGDPTIVWVPSGIDLSEALNATFTVTVQDIGINGEMTDFEYTVVLFDTDR